MQSAAEKLARVLDHTNFRVPVIPVVCNVTSNVLSVDTIKQQLRQHVVAPVRWSQSVDFCLKQNASTFLELGYGRVLTGLITQHSKNATCM
jgi:[acyl-carrier-protein] S-malonyltransferase